ncbi:hypothetical protein O8C97_03235, partial [Aliarcobacter butzleri]|uniref:beta strand repeat-containing protein n=3 Tax=Aliarcobacter butzleri TaxID=28197 RepID=UPI00263E9D3F
TDKQLKLSADNINVNATINNTNKTNGGVYFNAANNGSKVVFGADGKVIVNNVYQLQWINTALGGKYELGSNIDAGVTSSWNSGAGFNPIGETLIDNPFNGILDGKNYAISNLHIHRPDSQFVGLFKYIKNSTIKNIGLENTSITGLSLVGGLTGLNQGGLIENSYITGTINGSYSFIGGLVGFNQNGTINNSYAIGTVNGTASGNTAIGGLIGWNDTGAINNSYATGYVNGSSQVGGLVGNNTGTINNSYASNFVNGSSQVGGLTGNSYVQSNNSFYNIDINAGSMYDAQLGRTQEQIRNLITGEEWATNQELGRGYGLGLNTYLPFLKNVTKLSNTLFEDGHGTSANPYTITNWTQLQNINNSNILTQNYYFNLLNNLSNQTSDYTNLASSTANSNKGWNPIGTWIISFIGNFNGMGNTISNLYINRATSQNYIGLFGHTDSDTIIKNIGLINVDIKGKHYTGGLVGYSYGSTIENSYSSGNITGTDAVGGLVGYNNGGTIQNSYASNLITGNNYVGGLVGQNYGTIVNSYSGGNVTGNNTVGGLIGLNQGGLIENSYSTSSVMVNGGVGDAYIGGLVGHNYQGTVKNSYASGLVSVNISQINGTLYAGGLIGLNDNGTIENSFYDKETNTSNSMSDNVTYGKTKAEILSAFSGKNGWGSGRGASVEGYELALLPYLVGITREEDISKTILFQGGFGTELNPYTITNWTQLQNINNSNILTQNYYFNLLNNLNSSTAGYMGNTGTGWNPIGNNSSNTFAGIFDGKGFTISNLYINRPSQIYIGLFGWISGTIKNLGLVDVNITGNGTIGGLAGYNYNGTIENSYLTGNVTGTGNSVGGLVGYNNSGTITNSYTNGRVKGNDRVGGLVGYNDYGTVQNSYATAEVIGTGNDVGGLIGIQNGGKTENSYASGTITGNSNIGGLIGRNFGTITNSLYDKETNTSSFMNDISLGKTKAEILSAFNGKIGWGSDRGSSIEGYELALLPYLVGITREENISKTILFQSGFGTELNPYTITNWIQLQNINNSNILTQGYFFSLLNSISNQTSDYNAFNSGTGWNPIGNNYTNSFKGIFDGLGHTISDLYINRPTFDNQGLFGLTDSATTIRNIGLLNVDIKGYDNTGGVVGVNRGKIENSYTTGTINGIGRLGGLVGMNYETNAIIENSYSKANITGTEIVGGLVGYSYMNGKIINSYTNGTVIGGSNVSGGLVGFSENGATIENSFYDKTKNPNFDNALGTGKTTQEMSYGGTFKNASWDIIADSSVTSFTPIRKWDSVNNKYIWAISPLALNYNLGSKSTTYNGSVQNLSDFYSSVIVIPSGYEFLNIDYKFQKDGNDVTGYKNAETYSNIKVALNGTSATDEFLTLATTGNINGNLTITSKPIEPNKVVQNSEVQKVINSIQKSIQMPNSTQSLSNILSLVNNSTVDTQIQEQQNSNFLNTNQNIQTLTLGKNLGISIVNGGVNAPSINIEEIKNLLSTQN